MPRIAVPCARGVMGATVAQGDAGYVTEHRTEDLAERRYASAARLRSRRVSRQISPAGRSVLLVLLGFVLVFVLAVAVDAFASAGRVHPGVTVGGVDVGGKTPQDAAAVLKAELPVKAAKPITVSHGSATWKVKADDIGASFDYAKLLEDALAVGHADDVVASMGERFRAWFGGAALAAPATADPDKLAATISRIVSAIEVAPKDATLKVSLDKVALKPSATGIAVDRRRLERDLLSAFTADERAVTARSFVAQPKINDAKARAARAVVETMLAGPATVTYKAKSWTVSTAELSKMITFQQVQTGGVSGPWVLDPLIGAQEASKTIVPRVGASLGNRPVNARFATRKGRVTVIASKDGVGPDVEEFAASLSTVLKNPARGRSVELRTKVTAPRLTTDQARAMGVHERISTFTTTYSSASDSVTRARVNNIHVLGAALDGKLVRPGGTFSLNNAVGERTAAKGYQEAYAIVKGKLVPQLGGGICQVATTLFNSVFLSGFPVLERVNHSFYISHYPTGRDATVSWGGPDLRWKNPTSNWVLVSVSYTSDSITISLYGTDPGYDVTYKTGPLTNDVAYKIIKVNDPKLAIGAESVLDPGVNGKRCVVTRTVKLDGTLLRTDTFTSVYTPKNETVNVGTKSAVSKSATSTPTPKKP
jgi:vancomycin resistance protein YoaR